MQRGAVRHPVPADSIRTKSFEINYITVLQGKEKGEINFREHFLSRKGDNVKGCIALDLHRLKTSLPFFLYLNPQLFWFWKIYPKYGNWADISLHSDRVQISVNPPPPSEVLQETCDLWDIWSEWQPDLMACGRGIFPYMGKYAYLPLRQKVAHSLTDTDSVAKCQFFYTEQIFWIKFYPKKSAQIATN